MCELVRFCLSCKDDDKHTNTVLHIEIELLAIEVFYIRLGQAEREENLIRLYLFQLDQFFRL